MRIVWIRTGTLDSFILRAPFTTSNVVTHFVYWRLSMVRGNRVQLATVVLHLEAWPNIDMHNELLPPRAHGKSIARSVGVVGRFIVFRTYFYACQMRQP